MEFDFDHPIDRRNSDSLKWREARTADVIPMWVADMDFASPPCVLRAMRQRVDHGVFGYSVATDEVNQSVIAWLRRQNEVSFFEKAGVQLSDGAAFGGRGFMRLNFGCPRERLRAALERILHAVKTVDEPPIRNL